MATVTVEHCGPVDHFQFDLEPGLSILRGAPASGKSTVLRAIGLLAGEDVDLSVSDGTRDGGRVTGFGRLVPVGTRKRSKGELEINHLDGGRFAFADIVEPKEKTAAARDRKRIAALAALSGCTIDESALIEAIGEELWATTGVSVDPDDPVGTVGKVARKLQEFARNKESLAENARKLSFAERSKAQDFPEAPLDDVECQKKLIKAIERHGELVSNQQHHAALSQQIETATVKLAELKAGVSGKPAHITGTMLEAFETELREAQKRVADLTSKVADIRLQHEKAMSFKKQAELLEAQINQTLPDEVTQEQISEAESAVKEAKSQMEQNALRREAHRALERSKAHDEAAACYDRSAELFRQSAKQAEDVLGKLLGTDEVWAGSYEEELRLLTRHENRNPQECPFDELSEGERVLSVLKLLMPKIQSPGLLTIPQTWTQHLPDEWLARIDEIAQERGIIVLAAQVSDGPLRVERLNGQP